MAKTSVPLDRNARPFGGTVRANTPINNRPEDARLHPKATTRPPIGPAKVLPHPAPPPTKLPSRLGGGGK